MRNIHHPILLLICLTVLFASFVGAQKTESSDLFSIIVNGKKGFIDKTGKIVIEPRFDDVENFSDGLAAVEVGDWWGYIDKTGKIVIEPKFGAGYEFSEGIAVNILNEFFDRSRNRWVLLDKSGNITELPYVKDISNKFSESLIAVKNDKEKWGYINKFGEIVIPFKFERAMPFSEGLASVLFDGKYGYINSKGKFVIKPQFTQTLDFSEGLASVKLGGQLIKEDFQVIGYDEEFGNARWYFIDKAGNFVIKLRDDVCGTGQFSEDLASVQIRTKKGDFRVGFINRLGKFAINPTLVNAFNFSEGFAVVFLTENVENPSFIDKNGKVVFSAKDSTFGSFQNGLAQIQTGYTGIRYFDDDYEQGYIDKTGKVIWQPTN